jgi:carboxylate-amine ligase
VAEPRLHLFGGFGVELEYMLVDRDTFAVEPHADDLLAALAGEPASEVEIGTMAWSNELVRHVVELKTNGPAATLAGLSGPFQEQVNHANALLAPHARCLMPAGMHPFMNPERETQLWPYEYGDVYRTFDRIFGCAGHGWSNLQSVHLNLPFASDEEFGRLHAAVRLLLPLLPALAASSPLVEGRPAGQLDARLVAYRDNAHRVPSVTGGVIPEPVFSEDAYQERILRPMYRDIAPLDPEGVLQHEWLNARGAIARFDRGTIEIRLLDVQEYPAADLAIIELVVAVLQALVDERWSTLAAQQAWDVPFLGDILDATIRDADQAVVGNADYLRSLGLPDAPTTAGAAWKALANQLMRGPSPPLHTILEHGPLARRMLRRVGTSPTTAAVSALCADLCRCLAEGTMLPA